MDGEEDESVDRPMGIEVEGAPVAETTPPPMPEACERAKSMEVEDSGLGFVCPDSVDVGGEKIAADEVVEGGVSGVLGVLGEVEVELVVVGQQGEVEKSMEGKVENSMEGKDVVAEVDSEINQASDSLFVEKDDAMTSGCHRAQKIEGGCLPEGDGNAVMGSSEEATTSFPQSDGRKQEEEFDDMKVGVNGVDEDKDEDEDKNEDEDEDEDKDKDEDKEVNADSVLIHDMDGAHVVDSETNDEEHIVEVDISQKAESPIADEKEFPLETLPQHDFVEGTAMMEAELKMMEDEEAIVHSMDDCDPQLLGSPMLLPCVEEDVTGTTTLVSAGDDVMDALAVDVEDDDLSTSGAVSVEGGGRKKRGRPPKTNKVQASKQPSSKKKIEEDVCFICFDGGNLVVCDRRGCPKVYHPSCVNHDEAFFRAKGRWNCGWHICSICEKTAHYMCYTCTYSLCKGCIKETGFACIRENKGLCETCKDTVMLIETNDLANKTMVNFDDKNTWEYLFKDYWSGLKGKLSITLDEIAQAKKPSKKPSDEMYEANDGAASSSDDSSVRHGGSKSFGRKKLKRRSKVTTNEDNSVITPDSVRSSMSGENDWASKELLEFVSHMRGGDDTSVLSQFDFQALLLEYIKQNNLRDPRKKSQIICDKRLQSLFGKARVGHFEMLKLIESHFLIKDASQVAMDENHGATACDHDNSMVDVEGSGDAVTKISDKRRKTRKKSGRTPLINDSDYAAVDTHNINLIYLRRNLMEDLLDDENFYLKVIGCFVRIRISGSGQKQDMYRIVQVVGTSKTEERYKTGKKSTDIALEILNLNKTEVIHIDTISNQDFTEEECKRLRQSIKCGLIRPMTVGELQEKAITLQAIRINDWLESEKLRLGHLRDRASDTGRRKELRECVEKLERLNTPEEHSRRLNEIPKIHVDPNMDPAHESAEEDNSDDKRKGSYSSRLRESGSMRKGRELGSSGRSLVSHDIRNAGRYGSTAPVEQSRNSSRDSFNYAGDRKHESMETLTMVRAATLQSNPLSNSQSPRPMAVSSLASQSTGTGVSTASSVNEAEKMWHYQDPSGKIQGPFSMVQLHKWNSTGYFPRELKIWKKSEKQEDSILLADALIGRFQKEPTMLETPKVVSEGSWRGPTRGETMQTERYKLVQSDSAHSNPFSDTQRGNAWNSSRVGSVHPTVQDRRPSNSLGERWNSRVANDSNLPAPPRPNTGGWTGDHVMENKSSVSIQPMATSRWDANSSKGVNTYQSPRAAFEPNSTVSGQINHSHASTLGRVSNPISVVETPNKIMGNQPINEMKINVDTGAYKRPIYSSPTPNNEQQKSFSPDRKSFASNVKQNGNSSESMPSPTPTTNTTVLDAGSKVAPVRNPPSFIDSSSRTPASAQSQTHPSSQTTSQSTVDQTQATSGLGSGASQNNMNVGWGGGAVQGNTNVNWGTLPQGSTGVGWANQAQGNANMNVGMLPASQGNPTANPLWMAQGQGNTNTNAPSWGMPMQGNPNPNAGWGAAAVHANMNTNWVAPPQGYSLNPNWVPPTQPMQANAPTNVGWAAPPAQTQVNPNANLAGYGPGWNAPPAGNSNGWVPPRIDNKDKQQHSDHSGRGFQRQ